MRQALLLTVGAMALYVVVRWLPIGTNLQHADFQAAEGSGSSLEFCDPANPQFLPVVNVRSPIETRVRTLAPAQAGATIPVVLSLQTSGGKPIGPADLMIAHTRKLHVLAVDPTLTDYLHLHPEPGDVPGEWRFELTPQQAGVYRIFCDFTPRATGRGLYSSVDLPVEGHGTTPVASGPTVNWEAAAGAYRFSLTTESSVIRARAATDLTLTIRHEAGSPVRLGEVMGAYAHLVAFDEQRTGFAHLHPRDEGLTRAPGGSAPTLAFQVTIPEPGRYVIWAQVNLEERDVFVPFWINVV